MIDWILVIIDILLVGIVISRFEKRFLLVTALTGTSFIAEYLIASSILVIANVFRIDYVLLLLLLINLLIVIFNNRDFKESLSDLKRINFKTDWLSVVLVIIIVLCSWYTNGHFGMGQDQGVYETSAFARMNDVSTNRVYLHDEAQYINESSYFDSSKYSQDFYNRQYGLINEDDEHFIYNESDTELLSGIFHGIPGYPCLLALSGRLFGIDNLLFINHFIALFQGLILLFVLEEIGISGFKKIFVMIIALLSPEVIWVNKSALIENVLLLFFLCIMLCILANKDSSDSKKNSYYWLYSLAVAGFCFAHFSSFLFMPLFWFILVYEYLKTGNKPAIKQSIVINIEFIIINTLLMLCSQLYTYLNLTKRLNNRFGLSFGNIHIVCLFIAVAFVGILLSILLLKDKVRQSAKRFIDKRGVIDVVCVISLALFVFECVKLLLNLFDETKSSKYLLSTFTWYGMSIISGVVILPASLLFVLFNYARKCNLRREYLILVSWFYCVFVYTALVRPYTSNFYYFGRYICTSLFLIPLVFVLFIPEKKIWKTISNVLMTVAMAVVLVLSSYVVINRDDTYATYSETNDVISYFDSDDTIIFDDSSAGAFMLPIKYCDNANVFITYGNLLDEIDTLSVDFENVYYVTIHEIDCMDLIAQFDLSYSQDMQPDRGIRVVPFGDYTFENNHLYVYSSNYKDSIEYAFINNGSINLGLSWITYNSGFSSRESFFIWTSGESASMSIYIPASYSSEDNIVIDFEDINVADYGFDNYECSVYINGELNGTVDLLNDNSEYIVSDNSSIVSGVRNEITLVSDTWNPSDYGMEDTRILGVPLHNVTIVNN